MAVKYNQQKLQLYGSEWLNLNLETVNFPLDIKQKAYVSLTETYNLIVVNS